MGDFKVISEHARDRGLPLVKSLGFPFVEAYPDEPRWQDWTGDQPLLVDRSARTKIELTGPHAAPFLHNLCSNEIKALAVGDGCEVFFADRTARYVSFGHVYHLILGDGRHAFWLDLPVGTGSKMIQHLDKHLVSEQVSFADRTMEFCQFHLCGSTAAKVLSQAIHEEVPNLANHQHMVRSIEERIPCNIRRNDHLGHPGFDILVLHGRSRAVWDRLVMAGANPVGETGYQGLRIKAGYPEEPSDLNETVRVMEVDRPSTAISDKKGCYLGQEPIVMARDRGQLNRKLRRVALVGAGITVGPLLVEGKEIGRLTSLSWSREGEALGLAYLRRGFWDLDQTHSISTPGELAQLKVLD